MSTRFKIWIPILIWAVLLVALSGLLQRHQRRAESETGADQLTKLHQSLSACLLEGSSSNSWDWAEAGDKLSEIAAPWDAQIILFDASGEDFNSEQSVAPSLLESQSRDQTLVEKSVVEKTALLMRTSQLLPAADSLDAVPAPVFLRTMVPVKRETAMGGSWFWPTLFLIWMVPALVWGKMVKSFSQPIELMSKAFQDIKQGKPNVRIPELSQRKDEWADHYMQFRDMQESFQKRQDVVHDANQRFEAMLSSMAEGVMAIDSDGNVILANRAVRSMLMLTPSNIIGRRLRDSVRIPELLQAIDAAEQTGSFQKAEFKTLNEPRRVIDARLTSLDNDERAGIAIVFQDVTELRVLETMRRDFVANVSHELKTPLASIKAYAETLRLGAINDKEKNMSFVEQIESQAEVLHLQIQDLMVIARVESGSLSADLEPVSVNQACSDCVNQLFDLARISEIELKIELTDEDPHVMASEEGLLAIVSNLVTNAIHYTPTSGSVLVKTWLGESEGSGGLDVVIEVNDSGIGIGKSHHDRVFERFYRVDKARSRDVGGTGLGLAIVKHTVQAFDGKIQLESDIGKGTKFEVRFPLLKTS